MKHLPHLFFFSLLSLPCFLSLFAQNAFAGLLFEDFTLTPRSVSFNVSGSLPDTLPSRSAQTLFFSNPDTNATRKFSLFDFFPAETTAFTGVQDLDSDEPIGTGAMRFGDYFFINFDTGMTPSENLEGTLTAEWAVDIFDPTVVQSLNIYWGVETPNGSVDEGVFLGTVPIAVPEPGCFCLLCCLATVLSIGRIRLRASA